jgi:hypothetical protein
MPNNLTAYYLLPSRTFLIIQYVLNTVMMLKVGMMKMTGITFAPCHASTITVS